MATVNITNRYNNQDKRYAESIVVAQPSQLEEGGIRLSTPPVYAQFGDDHVSSVIEPDTIMKKAYLVLDEAFPAGALIGVSAGGVAIFTDVPGDATGLTVSTVEDEFFDAPADITVTVTGGTGDIMTGLARVVLDTDSLSLKNGNYANAVV